MYEKGGITVYIIADFIRIFIEAEEREKNSCCENQQQKGGIKPFKNAHPAQYYFDPVIAAPLTGPDTLQYLHRFPPLPVME